ncbi:family 2A encapsulin nanocompartment cargo protein cysteine desulfurase [Uliginosibacterium sp. 31-12]|uniref:family 2A encapsulin nanocompartment cargo protein cysteine desulfurase n=1 Tax=Uliginosibacterium sp. 31-12 TaxID=3062781 RepID=UPI0026E39666|nr:family 2A encapsulin nanocompartment cargo protein cysteine desulfurase [Uliginosibacterium sp. 31-12]MDO6385197.1 family 2A encapsulin nanocompartment cargo protein cysteine desulfurase [Uliginosibacterium sp. 31-12]
MTTQTPTSNPAGAGSLGGVSGLPDVASLAKLAGEFFSALPGNTATTALPGGATNGLPLGLSHLGGPSQLATPPQPSEPVLALGARAPALAPVAQTQTGLPEKAADHGGASAHSPAQGVPEAYAASLPSIDLPQAPVQAPATSPSSPYYFLGEKSAYPVAGEVDVPREDRVTARSFGLPGEDELRELLGGVPPTAAALTAEPAKKDQWFYFTDLTRNENGRAPASQAGARPPFDVNAVRRDFPILQERVNGKQLVWFDNAATTHKPQAVIDRLAWFYAHENSNIHRAAHELAARATDAYEGARDKVKRFIGASSTEEIIFVRGATEAINLVAKTWGAQNVGEGDEIIVSNLEHHANIVPWQQLAAAKGAKLRVIPVDDTGQILLDEYRKLLNDKTKIVAVTQVSNALGTVTPIKDIVALAHSVGAKALVDGAQSVSHMRVNVQQLDADFFVFSGHKIFGPTGIGVVYGKRDILENMPPWQGGGNMIADVTFERTIYQPPPNRFEAGTGNIADAVGLGAALDYVDRIGIENIGSYEHDLLGYFTQELKTIPGIRLIGTAAEKASVASFVLKGFTTQEVGEALNREGIAVRTGHHCAQPILRRFGVEQTVRPSLAFYNTCEEVDRMVRVVYQLATSRR